MIKETISGRQGFSIIFLFIVGSALVMTKTLITAVDLWLSIIFGSLYSIIFILIYKRITKTNNSKNIFDISENIFGKYLGKVINFLYICFAFLIGSILLRDFGELIITIFMPETPMYAPILFIMIISIWAVKSGLEVIARLANVYLIVNVLLIVSFSLILFPDVQLSELKPILYDGLMPVFRNSLSVYSFPFGLIIIFLYFINSFSYNVKYSKVYIYSLIASTLIILGVVIIQLTILGPNLYDVNYYPIYSIASKIKIGIAIQRLEIIPILTIVIGVYFGITFSLFIVSKYFVSIFKTEEYKFIVFPMGFLMVIYSISMFDNIMAFKNWLTEDWPYFASIFQIILPLSMLIICEVKNLNNKLRLRK